MTKLFDAHVRKGAARLAILLAIALAGPAAPSRAEVDGCASFDWPLTIEKEWFAVPGLPSYASGSTLSASPVAGFTLRLLPVKEVAFAVAPEKPAESGWGGIVLLPSPETPGLYQITLSDNVWIDVVQGGARLASLAHTGRKDCPSLRKSVRFEFGSGPATLQLSGAPGETLKIAVRKISEK
jgi:hypothetical protein